MFLTEPDERQLRSLYAVPAASSQAWRPFVRANFIATVDGRVTGRDGTSSSINNTADKQVFDVLRSLADVVLVGAGTVRAEGYGRISSGPDAAAPDLVVVSNSGIMPHSVAASPGDDSGVPRGRALLGTHAAAPQSWAGETIVAGEDTVDLAALVRLLHERGYRSVLCEGGPHLLTSMLAAGLVDELAVTTSPRLVGTTGARTMTTGPLNADLAWRGGAVIDGTMFALWLVSPSD